MVWLTITKQPRPIHPLALAEHVPRRYQRFPEMTYLGRTIQDSFNRDWRSLKEWLTHPVIGGLR